MLRTLAIIAAVSTAAAATAVVATEKVSRLVFPTTGFSINALEDAPPAVPSTVLQMLLPMTEGFAPNVNVRVEPYPGTMAQYAEMSKGQINSMGWTLITMKTADNKIQGEYTGKIPGVQGTQQDLHFYAEGFLIKGKIYFATATALESQWKDVGPKLKKCVASLKLEAK